MHTGKGHVGELILEEGKRYVRISCPPYLIAAPGQYLLASDGSNSPLPVPLFYTDSAPGGFIAVIPTMVSWNPGLALHLRGPLGRGFAMPVAARRVALVAFDDTPARLRALIQPALKQNAAVVLLSNSAPENLPDDVEMQPLSALEDILDWADYVAMDVPRGNLSLLGERLAKRAPFAPGMGMQVLIRTPIPCGGTAECGICAVVLKSEWKLACKDGPVFDWTAV
jgi:NAD(P)H-flavin reductase